MIFKDRTDSTLDDIHERCAMSDNVTALQTSAAYPCDASLLPCVQDCMQLQLVGTGLEVMQNCYTRELTLRTA